MGPGLSYALGVDRSLGGRRWLWRATGEDRVGLGIAQRLGLPEMLGRMLAMRGVDGDAAADFLTPTLRALLPDPHVLVDMAVAAERLAHAVRGGEKIGVFGDYDVDGACGGAILAGTLRSLGCAVVSHVPDRAAEGYGPNAPALCALADAGCTLVVCVDCGTAAGDVLPCLDGRADVIVLDHHKSEIAPRGIVATVNPNRLDCASGLSGLCAAAVAFLTMVATVRVLRRGGWFAGRAEPDLLALLDLVALATVCDVMPLTGLNRAFVTQGLKVLARRRRVGLAALLDVAQVNAPSAMSLGWALGPRINAAGRISDAGLGLRLLLTEDADEATLIARQLDALNHQRRSVEADMLDAAMAIGAEQVAAGHPAMVVWGEGWHPGVVGIVAGRLKERFNRPALVAAVADGVAKGSGRSVAGLDLGTAIIAARQAGLLTTGGGHAMAAGFVLPAAGLPALRAFVDERMAAAHAMPAAADLHVEGSLAVHGCTVDVARELARLAPFGPGNDEPLLLLPRARVVRSDRVGAEGNTVRAFVEGEAGGPRLKALMFRARDGAVAEALLCRDGVPLHLAGHLRAEAWQGDTSASFVVTDAALA